MDSSVELLRQKYPGLAAEYFNFVRNNGGAEGELAIDPGWLQVWPADFAISGSEEYGLPEFLPAYFAFASNGGGELFVIPHGIENPPVFTVPAGSLCAEDCFQVAENLTSLERAFRRLA